MYRRRHSPDSDTILTVISHECMLDVQGTPRTFFFVVNAVSTAVWTLALLLTISFLSLTQYSLILLVPITAAAGLTFGASWTLMAVTTSEMFGMKYISHILRHGFGPAR